MPETVSLSHYTAEDRSLPSLGQSSQDLWGQRPLVPHYLHPKWMEIQQNRVWHMLPWTGRSLCRERRETCEVIADKRFQFLLVT